jgi:hypothetical protein
MTKDKPAGLDSIGHASSLPAGFILNLPDSLRDRYYAKYIGVLGSNKSLPVDEDSYVSIFEDRIHIELLKNFFHVSEKITIPYRSMTDLQNVDAGKKVDIDQSYRTRFGISRSGNFSWPSLEKTCDSNYNKIQ